LFNNIFDSNNFPASGPLVGSQLMKLTKGRPDGLKEEIAHELGIALEDDDDGDLPAHQAGTVGGSMVRRMIAQGRRQMAHKEPE